MEDAIYRGKRERKKERENIPQHPTAETLAIFFHLNPTLMKMNEDPMAAWSALKKGRRWWLSTGGNFSEKRVPDTWPAYEGQRRSRKWCVLWFYNANGWPKGIPDRRGDCNTWLPLSWYVHVQARRYVCARGWPLFSCPLRNWVMSRHVAWVYSPIKSISGFWRDAFFFTSPYIILSTLILLSRFSWPRVAVWERFDLSLISSMFRNITFIIFFQFFQNLT